MTKDYEEFARFLDTIGVSDYQALLIARWLQHERNTPQPDEKKPNKVVVFGPRAKLY